MVPVKPINHLADAQPRIAKPHGSQREIQLLVFAEPFTHTEGPSRVFSSNDQKHGADPVSTWVVKKRRAYRGSIPS
jgi:hypothetical protein